MCPNVPATIASLPFHLSANSLLLSRKKKCIRYMTDAEFEEAGFHRQHQYESPPPPPPPTTSTDRSRHPSSSHHPPPSAPLSSCNPDAQSSITADAANLWSCYMPNLRLNRAAAASMNGSFPQGRVEAGGESPGVNSRPSFMAGGSFAATDNHGGREHSAPPPPPPPRTGPAAAVAGAVLPQCGFRPSPTVTVHENSPVTIS